MKSLALLSLILMSVTAVADGTLLGWTTPSPPESPNAQPRALLDSIAPPTPTVPTSVDTGTKPPQQTTNAPTSPPPTSTTPVPAPTTVAPSTPPTTRPPSPTATDPRPPPANEQPANVPTPPPSVIPPVITLVPAPTAVTPGWLSPSPPGPTPTNSPTAPSNNKSTPYVPPSIPTASADSTTFTLVELVACDETFVKTIETIYTKHRTHFDACANDSAYQIFPYSGTEPTPTQIHALATSKACLALSTACVQANLPECDVSGISVRSVVETLIKTGMDVERGHESPDTNRFADLCIWRRNSNLAKAAGVPYGNDSALYAEYARDVPEALAKWGQGDVGIGQSTVTGAGTVHGNSDSTGDKRVKALSTAQPRHTVTGTAVAAGLGMLVVTMTV